MKSWPPLAQGAWARSIALAIRGWADMASTVTQVLPDDPKPPTRLMPEVPREMERVIQPPYCKKTYSEGEMQWQELP